jgi:hypothetical protein
VFLYNIAAWISSSGCAMPGFEPMSVILAHAAKNRPSSHEKIDKDGEKP